MNFYLRLTDLWQPSMCIPVQFSHTDTWVHTSTRQNYICMQKQTLKRAK